MSRKVLSHMRFHGMYDASHPGQPLSPEEQQSRAQTQAQARNDRQDRRDRQARQSRQRQQRRNEAEVLGPLGIAAQRPTQPVRGVVSGGLPSLGKHSR